MNRLHLQFLILRSLQLCRRPKHAAKLLALSNHDRARMDGLSKLTLGDRVRAIVDKSYP
ncbi:MAG: hypothetical protein OEY21_07210 [Nitrospira sp.]|nr:hypothetical protein [Nitrospira sp.]